VKLRNEELHNLYASPSDQAKQEGRGGACSTHESSGEINTEF
jgi:hypothetical protein